MRGGLLPRPSFYTNFELSAQIIFNEACRMTGATSGYVALLSDSGEENEILFLEAGCLPCTVDPGLPMPIRGLRAESYRSGRTVCDNDFMNSEWTGYLPPGHVPLANVMFYPLNIEGRTVGILGHANKQEDFTEEDATLATAFGKIAAIALKNSRLMDQLDETVKKLEEFDELLVNPNKRIVELKKEVNTLCSELGRDAVYAEI
ncbi:MAG: GAF domain-containing protein [Desulfobulbaceae bacterium]|nr:GAF domain-containing protein [Desulfobulbaceae bacterium]